MPPRKNAAKTASNAKKTTTRKTTTRTRTVKALAESRRETSGPRRAIFIDVENTSGEDAILGALQELGFEKVTPSTELVAVGNWRVIGAQVGRMLAQRGARLVHTAPATGVKDWSDLSIAVASGIWLGRAASGDSIEIISADRAFDAVGDAAAAIGVTFRRLSYSSGATHAAEEGEPRGRRRSRRGGRRSRRDSPPPPRPASRPAPRPAIPQVAAAPLPPTRPAPSEAVETAEKDIHAARPEQIVEMIARLSAKHPGRGVNLDLLINELKAQGFGRPSGSPRLVTRLRMMKDVEVSPTGMVRLVSETVSPPPLSASEPAPESSEADAASSTAETPAAPGRRRSRRRGGRRRRSSTRTAAETPSAEAPASEDAPGSSG